MIAHYVGIVLTAWLVGWFMRRDESSYRWLGEFLFLPFSAGWFVDRKSAGLARYVPALVAIAIWVGFVVFAESVYDWGGELYER